MSLRGNRSRLAARIDTQRPGMTAGIAFAEGRSFRPLTPCGGSNFPCLPPQSSSPVPAGCLRQLMTVAEMLRFYQDQGRFPVPVPGKIFPEMIFLLDAGDPRR